MRNWILCSLLVLFLAACGGSPEGPTPTATSPVTVTETPELAPPPTAIIAPTLPPDPTATSDMRLPPERWQEWPIVPAVTGRAIEIYRLGLTLGNDPHAFSKVGDCQNVKAAFMGFFDDPERYILNQDYQYLQETIDQFSGYFNTDGQAVKGGFNAATVLSPLWANPEVCLAGENPLECELRITKPVIVFVSFEVWWEGRTEAEYEKYMRQIIETVMAHGSVPILATKADNVEGDHGLNLTTARLAHEYDLPLWNFWLAVQPLPYHGLDPVRDDGFHISTEGWNVRSFTGLQTLDSIWKGLRDVDTAVALTATPTSTPATLTGFLPTPATGPWLATTQEGLIFGMAVRDGGKYQPQGVYLFDLEAQTTATLLGTGWDFQARSPGGTTFLVNLGSLLYETDGLALRQVSPDFYPYGMTGAMYLEDGSIVFIEAGEGSTQLVHMQVDGGDRQVLTDPGEAPIELYASSDGIRLTWESGSCSGYHVCDRQGAWLTDMQSGESRFLNGLLHPLLSPDGEAMIYAYETGENTTNLAFASPDGIPTRTYPVFGDILVEAAWEPGGGWLAFHMAVRSSTSGRITDGMNYLIDPVTLTTRTLPSALMLNPRLLWSDDSASLAWLGTDWTTDRYSLRLFRVDVESGEAEELTAALNLADTRYLYVTNGSWWSNP